MSTSVLNCIYSSSACNKTPRALDWGNNEFISYCSCNAVEIFIYGNKNGGFHYQTLIGHKKLVTSVHWIQKSNDTFEEELISTSADNTSIVWTLNKNEYVLKYILQGHTNVVKTASGIYLDPENDETLLVATSSADSSIKIWKFLNREVECAQTISLGNGFALDLKLILLNKKDQALIVGREDAKIHIYLPDKDGLFSHEVSLYGHEDWIQSLDFLHQENGTILLASGSQDCYIRIWKILEKSAQISQSNSELKLEEQSFITLSGREYIVSLDSILSGHENWIYSVKWNKDQSDLPQILSSSMDKTIIIWEPDPTSGIWIEKVRVGEIGGNTLGFYGSVFSPCGKMIIAHGFQGAIHIWKLNEELNSWEPGISFGGHFSSVQDIDWDPYGEFLLSCSLDQTTRIHAPYKYDESELTWHEIARPQIHGYDMVCLTMLSRFKYVSAGDEKVLRVFQAPRNFAENLENICKLDVTLYILSNLPEGANVPSLGLTNKAIFQEDLDKIEETNRHSKDKYPDFYFTPTNLKEPPPEEVLLQNTLWPEVQKLYGHPYEVFCVTSNHSKTLIASACKATKIQHAAIILWNTSDWKQIGQILFHNLTITQLEFSPNDEYLLSVSRDRMWALYQHFPKESPPYRKIANLDKKNNVHTRIIWSCSWTFDSAYFATASRDKKVAIWGKKNQDSLSEFSLSTKPLEVEDSATALSFAPCFTKNNRYILAIGLENGCIYITTWFPNTDWNIIEKLDQKIAHHLNVNRLKFAPVSGDAGSKEKDLNIIQLASCANDFHTKVYQVYIDTLT